jgi:hypothetical protein
VLEKIMSHVADLDINTRHQGWDGGQLAEHFVPSLTGPGLVRLDGLID